MATVFFRQVRTRDGLAVEAPFFFCPRGGGVGGGWRVDDGDSSDFGGRSAVTWPATPAHARKTSTEARVLVKSDGGGGGSSGLCVCCSPLASGRRFFFFMTEPRQSSC